ncbi:MAG TPA: response regulator transcription factor [Chitinophagaceae bacterium]|nr:MAG: winged helix family two component transcriptional regulator [Bacteroidetes bacterium OLB11]HMN33397.1 response regulator transcription factor [Chitinophagaceae bacterium]
MQETKYQILIVEDEESLRETLKLNLELEGYSVTAVEDGKKAIKTFKEEYFDCILLDVMLPEFDGIFVCEAIRLQNDKVPILFLSAKNSGEDKVLGLKKGGDDYITKPFNLEELLLRIEKLIIRNNSSGQIANELSNFKFGNCEINFQELTCVDINQNHRSLTKKETQFLKLLIDNKNNVVSREQILKMVWGYNVFPTTRTIDNFITTFRKYFEEEPKDPKYFISVRGVGYKFMYSK